LGNIIQVHSIIYTHLTGEARRKRINARESSKMAKETRTTTLNNFIRLHRNEHGTTIVAVGQNAERTTGRSVFGVGDFPGTPNRPVAPLPNDPMLLLSQTRAGIGVGTLVSILNGNEQRKD
jgi:hypothetical protein